MSDAVLVVLVLLVRLLGFVAFVWSITILARHRKFTRVQLVLPAVIAFGYGAVLLVGILADTLTAWS